MIAKVEDFVAKAHREQQQRLRAIAPWAPQVRIELALARFDPATTATNLRAIAAEMTANAERLLAAAAAFERLAHQEA